MRTPGASPAFLLWGARYCNTGNDHCASGPILTFASPCCELFANVRIKGPLANITSWWSFGFDIRFASLRLTGQRMSDPLHQRERLDLGRCLKVLLEL